MLPAHYSKKETGYFCRFTFGQFFTLLVLEIFTLFFIFYLGAKYGDELLGVRISPAPVAANDMLPKVTTTDPNVVAATTQDPEIKALAKDLLKSAPTPDLKQRVAEMLQESAARNHQPLPAAPRPVPSVAAERPEVPEEPAPVIQTAPAAQYSVQIGSYPNVDEAHALVDQWKAKGYPVFLTSAEIPNRGRWYRVRLGGFETKEEAQTYLAKLKNLENIEAFIVTNE